MKNERKTIVAINLLAWTAAGVLWFRNCNPAEEPLKTRTIEVSEPLRTSSGTASSSTATSTAGTSSCSKFQCAFEIKDDSKVPRNVKMMWLAQIGLDFADIRQRQLEMENAGMQPLLTYKDPVISRLIRSMTHLNEKAGAEYGFEPIPVSGPDTREKFRSLNAWMGRPPDAPLDDQTVSSLDLKVVEAVMQ